MSRLRWMVAVLSAITLFPRAAVAVEQFDLIYPARIDVYLPPGTYGFTDGTVSFALFVNTGDSPVSAAEIGQATFDCTSSVPGFAFVPFVGNLPSHAPILPNQAVGSIEVADNGALTDAIQPGETLVNTFPDQVMALGFLLPDPLGSYEGAVFFDVVMHVGDKRVSFRTEVDVHQNVTHPSRSISGVTRVSSAAPMAATPMTWGKLKSLYR